MRYQRWFAIAAVGLPLPVTAQRSAPEFDGRALDSWLAAVRLWNLKDPNNPVDRGLYYLPFRLRWYLPDQP